MSTLVAEHTRDISGKWMKRVAHKVRNAFPLPEDVDTLGVCLQTLWKRYGCYRAKNLGAGAVPAALSSVVAASSSTAVVASASSAEAASASSAVAASASSTAAASSSTAVVASASSAVATSASSAAAARGAPPAPVEPPAVSPANEPGLVVMEPPPPEDIKVEGAFIANS